MPTRMRNILPLTCALALAISSHAQIPNGGFESWYSNVNYMEPTDWWTTNAVTYTLAQVTSCDEGTPGAVGASYIQVTSRDVGSIVEIGRTTCGNEITGYPGFAYAARPATFDGQVRYAPQGGDVGQVHAALWGWNAQMTAREVIAVATYNITVPIGSWQAFSIPFTYLSSAMPDTARVFIVASGNTPVDGSSISVDDLGFGGTNGHGEQDPIRGLLVHPSPAVDRLNVIADELLVEVWLSDPSGRELYRTKLNATSAVVDIAQLPVGTYLVHLRSSDGLQVTRRFMKE